MFADHTGPVSCLAFTKGTSAMLASGSWDKTVKLWEVFESRGAKETLVQLAEGESVGMSVWACQVIARGI